MDRKETDSSSNKSQAQQVQEDISRLRELGVVSAKKSIFNGKKPLLESSNSMEVTSSPDSIAATFPEAPLAAQFAKQKSSVVIESPSFKSRSPETLISKIVEAPNFETSFQKLSQQLVGSKVTSSLRSTFSRAQHLVSSMMTSQPAPKSSEKQPLINNEEDLLAVTAYFAAMNAEKRQLTLKQEDAIRANMARVIESIRLIEGLSPENQKNYRKILNQIRTALFENMDIPYPAEHQPDKKMPTLESVKEVRLTKGLGDDHDLMYFHQTEKAQRDIENGIVNPLNQKRASAKKLTEILAKKDDLFTESRSESLQQTRINKSFAASLGHQEEVRDIAAQAEIINKLKGRAALFAQGHDTKKPQVTRPKF